MKGVVPVYSADPWKAPELTHWNCGKKGCHVRHRSEKEAITCRRSFRENKSRKRTSNPWS